MVVFAGNMTKTCTTASHFRCYLCFSTTSRNHLSKYTECLSFTKAYFLEVYHRNDYIMQETLASEQLLSLPLTH